MLCAVIVNYNDASTVCQFLQMVIDYKIVEKIIIVDNHSTDDSADILREKTNDKTDLLVLAKNGGYGYGNNAGIRYAVEKYAADYILISNPDVVVDETTLFSLTEILQQDSLIAAVAPFMTDIHGVRKITTASKLPTIWRNILTSELVLSKTLRMRLYKDILLGSDGIKQVDCLSGSMLMVNAQHMLKYGMYDENVFLYGEEGILGLKFAQHGLKTVLNAENSFIHHHSVSISKTITSATKKREMLMASKLYVMKEYLHASWVQMQIARFLGRISMGEIWLLSKIRGFSGQSLDV